MFLGFLRRRFPSPGERLPEDLFWSLPVETSMGSFITSSLELEEREREVDLPREEAVSRPRRSPAGSGLTAARVFWRVVRLMQSRLSSFGLTEGLVTALE